MHIGRRELAWILFWTLSSFSVAMPNPSHAQSIVLRDLTLIDKPQIESMDTDQLVLSSGQSVPWSKILQGSVGDKQETFDRFIREVGSPLFRIESRLAGGNYDSLQPLTNQLLTSTANTSTPPC